MSLSAPLTDDVESLLSAWGAWARGTTDRLGYPSSSSISDMVESVKVFPKRSQGGASLTARGKQTRVMTAKTIGFVEPQIMAVDRIIAHLPGRFKKLIYRRYLWGQPDRIACVELRMTRGEYRDAMERAVSCVTQRLELS